MAPRVRAETDRPMRLAVATSRMSDSGSTRFRGVSGPEVSLGTHMRLRYAKQAARLKVVGGQ